MGTVGAAAERAQPVLLRRCAADRLRGLALVGLRNVPADLPHWVVELLGGHQQLAVEVRVEDPLAPGAGEFLGDVGREAAGAVE
eukprot:4301568-Lingulodinium_polyedra.AAC.1